MNKSPEDYNQQKQEDKGETFYQTSMIQDGTIY